MSATVPVGESSPLLGTEPSEKTPRDFGLLPVPSHLRWDPSKPYKLSMGMNIFFAITGTFTVANLSYSQPLLIHFAESFGVSYDAASRIPALVQAGYATGILLITPLGDLVKRRPLVLLLYATCASLAVGCSITRSFLIFEILTFCTGMTAVTMQVVLPLVADLVPPEKRASSIAIVATSLSMGVLLGRVLSGVLAQFVPWRFVYVFAATTQLLALVPFYLLFPDFPPKTTGLTYLGILRTMLTLAVTEPVLVQVCIAQWAGAAVFTSFWVTLTFLLSAPPYNFDTLQIGMFGVVGMFGVFLAPFTGRWVDRQYPLVAALFATFIVLIAQTLQIAVGGFSIIGVIAVCFVLDLGRGIQTTSLTSQAYSFKPEARSRINAVHITSLFIGSVTGTSVGTKVFIAYGWRPCAIVSLAWIVVDFVILLLRGPHCADNTWFGWEGGWRLRKPALSVAITERSDA